MKQPTPPRIFHRLLSKMFSNTSMEELEGDLLDDFHRNIEKYGTYRAKLYFIMDVLRLIRLVPRSRRNTQNSKTMNNLFLFNIKYSLRSIKKHRVYQSLNIASLTLGFTCFCLIYLFVFNHYQKDSFLKDRGNIVTLNYLKEGSERTSIHAGMPPLLKADFPEIEASSRMNSYQAEVSTEDSQEVFIENIVNAEPDFFTIFQLEIVLGEFPEAGTNSILISESLAKKLFSGVEDALNQEIKINSNNRQSSKFIRGIIKDLPVNTSISTNLVAPLSLRENMTALNSNFWMSYTTFFKIKNGTNKEELASKIPEYLKQHTDKEALLDVSYLFRSFDEIKNNPKISTGFIQSIDKQTLVIFEIVGLVVLLLALANYINLSTSLTLKRTQEVGIKHVMGATTRSLMNQLLTESLIVGFTSILCCALLVAFLLPNIEAYIGLEIRIPGESALWIPIVGVAVLIVIVALASLYPAILFSTSKHNLLLKGNLIHSPKSKWLRSVLMSLQFAISTFLIVGCLTFLKQLQFIHKSHNLDNVRDVLVVKGIIGNQKEVIREKLLALPEVEMISFSSVAPGPSDNLKGQIGTVDFEKSFDYYIVDENFIDVMGLEMIAGQGFFKDSRNKESHVIFNEAMIDLVKGEENPLNKEYKVWGSTESKVIGIVQNFPVGSIKSEVAPTLYMQVSVNDRFSGMINKIAIKLAHTNPIVAMKKIESEWAAVYPDQPFEVELMSDRISRIYSTEMKMGQMFGIFTGVAVCISCLGLIGMLTYLIQIKMKEIGIRKVLGANFSTLANLLTFNIWKVLVLASLVSFPLSYYFLKNWLSSFVYRTDISVELFILTAVFFVAVIGITVFWQIRNAVRVNPTEVLRNE